MIMNMRKPFTCASSAFGWMLSLATITTFAQAPVVKTADGYIRGTIENKRDPLWQRVSFIL